MTKISAGLLMYRMKNQEPEVFLVHPGGPFFRNKDEGWWTIPKGLPESEESLLKTSIREFHEETGIVPGEPYLHLGEIKQKGGKTVHAWAFQGDWRPETGLKCNTFQLEWPPKSGNFKSFPEVDKAEWMTLSVARNMINQQQVPFLERLEKLL